MIFSTSPLNHSTPADPGWRARAVVSVVVGSEVYFLLFRTACRADALNFQSHIIRLLLNTPEILLHCHPFIREGGEALWAASDVP